MATREYQIEEDKKMNQGLSESYDKLMTPEQMKRGDYYATQYMIRRGEVDSKYKRDWDYLQRLYECKRDAVPDDPDYPNSFIPLITPTVEGQIASMMESDIDFRHITNNPGHSKYMSQLDAASEYYRKKSKFKLHFKDFGRYYDLLGNCWVTISWDKTYTKKKTDPGGIPRIEVPPLLSVLVDGRIKDVKDLQNAEYIIIEKGFVSIAWARREYGDEYADAIISGMNRYDGDDPDMSYDDNETFMLLHVWTRTNEEQNLQLIEMDANGLVLRESDPSSPYYEFVDNEYPIGIARMIPQLGQFYGFGDGAILKPMQECVNNLVDEMELAARFSSQARTYVDPNARMDGRQITSNPADIIIAKDPRNNILTTPPAGVSPVIFNMVEFLLREAQKATRFHESMTGNQQGTSATATQINTQLSQGAVGIKDKKTDLSEVMGWADMYALKLCMEKWDRPFWAALGDDYSEWIDPQSIVKVRATVPTTTGTIKKMMNKVKRGFGRGEAEYRSTTERFEDAKSKDGKNYIITELEFSTRVIIGESIPKGRTDMYNILLGLSQMQVVNKDGQPEPLISSERLRQAMEEILGMKLKTEEEEQNEQTAERGSMAQEVMNQINPIGNNNTVQTPTASNLQQTVPQMPENDSRRVQM